MFGLMIWGMYLRFIVPVLGVFYGTSLIADEVEDKTITYFSRGRSRGEPSWSEIHRLSGLHGLRRAAVRGPGLPPDRPVKGQHRGRLSGPCEGSVAAGVGLAVYGAVFAFVGAEFKRPLLVGLIFVFGWEQASMAFPGYLKQFTVTYYFQALVPTRDA